VLKLSDHANLGRAFGREPQGRAVFVPYAIPGEVVRIQIVEEHRSWLLGYPLEILEPSPRRVEPRCRHFGECGGCHYQHMEYTAQLEAKARVVAQQLERIGGLQNPPVEAALPSPSPWNSRNQLQFSLDEQGRLGFHAARSDQIVAIQECHLPEPPIADLWPRIDLQAGVPIERITLRCTPDQELMVIFISQSPPEVQMALDLPASLVWLDPGGAAVLAGQGFLVHRVGEHDFQVSAGSFFQVNSALTPTLVDHVLDMLDPLEGQRYYDLYAGVGLFSVFLAERGARVTAVEGSPWAAADFEINLDPYPDIELYQADVAQALPALGPGPAGLIVDPPRAGLGRGVVEGLARLDPPKLVYVSCDPATMARDARLLVEQGFRLQRVVPLDMFPQTYHVETVSLWLRG